MKRLIAAIIAVSYLCLSTGFTMHVHYCMGQRIGASLIDSNTHKCSHCGMTKKSSKKGCCKDEIKIVKGKSVAALAKAVINAALAWDALVPSPEYYSFNASSATLASLKSKSDRPHGPPVATDLRRHVRNCVFLI